MTKIAAGEAGFYQDLSQLKSVRGSEGLAAAAEGFETMFLQLVLKNMRAGADALADEDNPLASQQQRFYRELYDGQIATQLAATTDLGIADAIVRQLGGVVAGEPAGAADSPAAGLPAAGSPAAGSPAELKNGAAMVALPLQGASPEQEGGGLAAFQQPLRAPAKPSH